MLKITNKQNCCRKLLFVCLLVLSLLITGAGASSASETSVRKIPAELYMGEDGKMYINIENMAPQGLQTPREGHAPHGGEPDGINGAPTYQAESGPSVIKRNGYSEVYFCQRCGRYHPVERYDYPDGYEREDYKTPNNSNATHRYSSELSDEQKVALWKAAIWYVTLIFGSTTIMILYQSHRR